MIASPRCPGFRSLQSDMTPLMWASEKGNAPVARLLLEAGADKEARASALVRGSCARRAAVPRRDVPVSTTAGSQRCFRRRRGVATRVPPTRCQPAFHRLCPTQFGSTPLIFAAASGHASVVQVLLDAGADAGAKSAVSEAAGSRKQRTVAGLAPARYPQTPRAGRRRVAAVRHAYRRSPTQTGKTALDVARQYARIDVVTLLTR